MNPDVTASITLRPAQSGDISGIVSLVNGYAAEAIMLYRSPESVSMTLHDFVVAVDLDGTVMACGALKEYSPSLAEVASVAVARDAHGLGLGTAIVAEVERLARKRGIRRRSGVTASSVRAGFDATSTVLRARSRKKWRSRRSLPSGGLPRPRRAPSGEPVRRLTNAPTRRRSSPGRQNSAPMALVQIP